jgi:hypothetical protein
MLLEIAPGSVAVPTPNNTGSVLCHSDAVENLTPDPAEPAGSNRCDLIICQARGADLDGGTDNDFVFAVVKGVPFAPPSVPGRDIPATPPGAVALARAYAIGGSVTYTPANLVDMRLGAPVFGAADTEHAEVWCSDFALPNSSVVMLPFTNVLGGTFDTGAHAFICPRPGRYLVTAAWTANTATPVPAFAYATIHRNAAEALRGVTGGPGSQYAPMTATVAGTVHCEKGDALQIGACIGASGFWVQPQPPYTYAQFTYQP